MYKHQELSSQASGISPMVGLPQGETLPTYQVHAASFPTNTHLHLQKECLLRFSLVPEGTAEAVAVSAGKHGNTISVCWYGVECGVEIITMPLYKQA